VAVSNDHSISGLPMHTLGLLGVSTQQSRDGHVTVSYPDV